MNASIYSAKMKAIEGTFGVFEYYLIPLGKMLFSVNSRLMNHQHFILLAIVPQISKIMIHKLQNRASELLGESQILCAC